MLWLLCCQVARLIALRKIKWRGGIGTLVLSFQKGTEPFANITGNISQGAASMSLGLWFHNYLYKLGSKNDPKPMSKSKENWGIKWELNFFVFLPWAEFELRT